MRVKSWAQIPTQYASLKPVSSVEEAGLSVGKVIKAAVVDEGAQKRLMTCRVELHVEPTTYIYIQG